MDFKEMFEYIKQGTGELNEAVNEICRRRGGKGLRLREPPVKIIADGKGGWITEGGLFPPEK